MTNRFRSVLIAATAVVVLAPAARGDLIVDNFSEQSVTGFGLVSSFFGDQFTWAQEFNTAGTDYFLESVSVRINRDTPNAAFVAKLWTAAGSTPQTEVLTLSLSNLPSPGSFQTHTFTPDNAFLLDGSTNYFFSIENTIGTDSFLQGTVFGSNNFTGNGTLLSSIVGSANSGQTWGASNPNEMAIRITGSVPEPSSAICCGLILALGAVTRRRTTIA